uniref:Uncharacterized protein n=1 Tax=Anopheles atroparvus TaxID=41427 RepID=A0AAG5DXX1_ANOAO
MNAANSKRFDRLLRDIELHNLLLRRFGNILLVDGEFLRFYDIIDTAERSLLRATTDEELDRFSPDSGSRGLLSLFELQVHQLRRAKASCLQRIDCFRESQKRRSAEDLKKRFSGRLETNLQQLQQIHEQFRYHVLRAVWNLGDISLIAELESLVTHTDQLVGTVRKNHLNCLRLLPSVDLQHTISLSCSRLKFTVHSLLIVILVRFLDLLLTMDGEEHIRELHEKLQREIRQSLNEMQVNEEELASLRQKLFPSTASLGTQRTVAIEQRDLRAIDLQEQLREIDLLEDDKQELEGRVAELIVQRETIQRQLDERKRLLHEGVREIVRLERLIVVIEQQISDATVEFQRQAEFSEQRRLEVLKDKHLSSETRQKLLAECDAELMDQRKSHTSNMNLLEARRDELKRISANLAQNLETFRDEIEKKHQEQIAELEIKKMQASPSELEQFAADIKQQQTEHEENLTMLERARARSEYLTDDRSRYSITETGERVYHPAADGHLGKERSTSEVMQEDETGVFYLDKFGQKIYHRQYFTDPQGKYYIDVTGTRIYTTTADCKASTQSSPASPHQTNDTSVPATTDPDLPPSEDATAETESERDRRERVAADVAYIDRTLAVPLRKGLAAVARAKPADPVGYLADYLALQSENAMEVGRRQQLLERVRTADEKANVSAFPGCM